MIGGILDDMYNYINKSRRINLWVTNPTNADIPLDFNQIGGLVQPIKASSMSVYKISIPNSATPNFRMPTNYNLTFSLEYLDQMVTVPMIYESRGATDGFVYEMDTIVSMMNTALATCVANLNVIVPLPSVDVPRFIYSNTTQLYSLIALTSAYDNSLPNPIRIHCNVPLFYILQSMPIIFESTVNSEAIFLFKPTPENRYLTNYTKIEQESISLPAYAFPRLLLLTTPMPIKGEIIISSSGSSSQSYLNILQNLTFDYSVGASRILSHNDFAVVENRFRSVAIEGQNGLYDIKVSVYYVDSEAQTHKFMLPPHQMAIIGVEFVE